MVKSHCRILQQQYGGCVFKTAQNMRILYYVTHTHRAISIICCLLSAEYNELINPYTTLASPV